MASVVLSVTSCVVPCVVNRPRRAARVGIHARGNASGGLGRSRGGVLRRDKPCPIAPPVHRLGKEGPAEHNRAPAASWRDARILANRRAAMRVSASIR